MVVSDIMEAVQLIETYKLSSLVWDFDDCPLSEIKHYVPKGKEEFVVVAHKENSYIPYRLVFYSFHQDFDVSNYLITLDYHSEYNITIVMNAEDEE